MTEVNIQQEVDIQTLIKEIPVAWGEINKIERRSKEMLALNWYRFGKKAAAFKDYCYNTKQSFPKLWQKTFPKIKIRRVEQSIVIATEINSEDKMIKFAKLGFDNIYILISTLKRCKKENVQQILKASGIITIIQNYDDPHEEGLHRIQCFNIFIGILEELDISKINIQLLWDAVLANKSFSKHSVKTIQTLIDEGKNIDDYLKMIIQTGGGEPQPSTEDNLASINVTNSRFIEITKMYIDKKEVPEDFDLNRLAQSMSNCSQLIAIKEANNVAA